MDLTGLSLVITASVAAVTSLGVAIGKAWRASVQRAATEQQSKATVEALQAQVAEIEAERDDWKVRHDRLWALLEGLTS